MLCQGQTVEDIDIFNRAHSAKHVKDNEAVEGFEWNVDDDLFDPHVSLTSVNPDGVNRLDQSTTSSRTRSG